MSTPTDPKAGDVLWVLPEAEILATLDEHGCLDELPFMPEMRQFCGRSFRVRAVAHKTCDTIDQTGGRRMRDAVHLEDQRCDGAAHGRCEAGCTLFWKLAWLSTTPPVDARGARPADVERTARIVDAACFAPGSTAADPTYRCQTTQLLAATEPLSPADVRQYWRDVRTGNHTIWRISKLLLLAGYEGLVNRGIGYRLLMRIFDGLQRIRGGQPYPRFDTTIPDGQPTPTRVLDLCPGDKVRVKPVTEIAQTINKKGFNRGMRFDIEMVKYCGGEYRVHSRVNRIINEKTGKMMTMTNPCILLEDVYCRAHFTPGRRGCPRAVNTYWREIWLERVD